MFFLIMQLLIMLFIILLASQGLTNALEYFGHRLGLSAGVIGSIFAAIATALPETTVPFIALFAGTSNQKVNEEIGVGAILGAPLMISTLSTCLMALFVIKRRGLRGWIQPEKVGFVRDLNYFILAFLLSALAMYVPLQPFLWRILISIVLVLLYCIYLYSTFKASKQLVAQGYGVVPDEPLIFSKLGLKDKNAITLQLLISFLLLIGGTKGFIVGIEQASKALNISALLISLLIVPIATELPEKINSILWIRKSKDTLAFGNLTGALVFQGSLLPALGVLLTTWQPQQEVSTGILLTLCAALWLRIMTFKKGLPIAALLVNGLLYFLYIYLALK